jgi:hypothetical protein
MQLQVYIGKISSRMGKMQFDCTSYMNGARCKRLRMWMK